MTISVKPILALLSSGELNTMVGLFKIWVFHDGLAQAIVLTKGDVSGKEDVLCRIHSQCISGHVFGSVLCDCQNQMLSAQRRVIKAGAGIIIFLDQEGRGNGAAADIATIELKKKGIPQDVAYRQCGFEPDARRFDLASKVLKYFQIKSVCFMSSSVTKKKSLESWGIQISSIKREIFIDPERADIIIPYVKSGLQEPIRANDKSIILTVGDLCVDYEMHESSFRSGIVDKSLPLPGGTGFNAAVAFKKTPFDPVVFGKIGDDADGRTMQLALESSGIKSIVATSKTLHTGNCHIIFRKANNERFLIKEEHNANDYDIDNLHRAIELCNIGNKDIAFIVAHALGRFGADRWGKILSCFREKKTSIIVDMVPHNLYETVTPVDFKQAINGGVNCLISEFNTLLYLCGEKSNRSYPESKDWSLFIKNIPASFIVVRYGIGNISQQTILNRVDSTGNYAILEDVQTGYEDLQQEMRRGFGDFLTAELICKYFLN
jgi:GTP cyclohydrolase II